MAGVMLLEYSNEYYEGYDYLSLGFSCRGLVQRNAKKSSRKDLTLWLKKEGGKDYRKTDKEVKSEFKVYNIPNRLQSEVKILTQDINSHDHFRALQSYDNKWDTLCKELVDKDNVR